MAAAKDDYYSRGSKELATESLLTMQRLEARRKLTNDSERLVVVLVGLPARGKSFVARKLENFMTWHGAECRIFNVGKYRRQVNAESTSRSGGDGACDANFFDAKNEKAAALREKAAELALVDMLQWLDDEDEKGSDEEDDDDNVSESEDDKGQDQSFSHMNPNVSKSEPYTRHHDDGPVPMVRWSTESFSNTSSDMVMKSEGRIAIFDATNSTKKRRQWLLEMCTSPEKRPGKPTGCVFLESICDDEEVLLENFKSKISCSPDYKGMSEEEALADLKMRVAKYEEQYETVDDDRLSYIKIFNLSSKIMVNHCYGRMSKIIVPAIMAWNIGTRPIFLCRPGQTFYNIITDDEDYVAKVDVDGAKFADMSRHSKRSLIRGYNLGRAGTRFSNDLYDFCLQEGNAFVSKRASVMDLAHTGTSKTGLASSLNKNGVRNLPFPLQIFTSTMPRAIQTVMWDEYDFSIEDCSNLNPLDKGDFSGSNMEEIKSMSPSFYSRLEKDAFHTRFPGGESYCDLIKRLVSVVVDMEQQVIPTLVVSHVSVLQILIAYFRNSPVEKCMEINVPLHTVIKFTPARGGGWSESVHELSPSDEGAMSKVGSETDISQVTEPMTEQDEESPLQLLNQQRFWAEW